MVRGRSRCAVHSQKSTGPFQVKTGRYRPVNGPVSGCSPPTSRVHPVYRLTTVELEARNDGTYLTTKPVLRRSSKMKKKPCCVSQEGLLVQKDSLKRTYIQSIYLWTEQHAINQYIEISHSSLYPFSSTAIQLCEASSLVLLAKLLQVCTSAGCQATPNETVVSRPPPSILPMQSLLLHCQHGRIKREGMQLACV